MDICQHTGKRSGAHGFTTGAATRVLRWLAGIQRRQRQELWARGHRFRGLPAGRGRPAGRTGRRDAGSTRPDAEDWPLPGVNHVMCVEIQALTAVGKIAAGLAAGPGNEPGGATRTGRVDIIATCPFPVSENRTPNLMNSQYPYWLAGKPQQPNSDLQVIDKYTGEIATRVAMADQAAIDQGIAATAGAAEPMRRLLPWQRQDILLHCVKRFEERQEELASILCAEAGKPIRDSRGEVTRLIDTFRIAAGEAVRLGGEVLNLQISPRASGYRGMDRRVPVGPCSFISPFNFPLNLTAHKIAPAIAAGCPFVLKPASLTPVGALVIGETLAETDLPAGAFSILPCHREQAASFTTDPRLKMLSFTGSADVGWKLKGQAGQKKVVLELGGNAACIVDRDAHLDDAVERIVFGAFYQSGQSCVGVQRILVHEAVYQDFTDRLVAKTRTLKCGDPRDESVFVGPMISQAEADRVVDWISRAVAAGATLLCGGGHHEAIVEATLLADVPRDQPVCAGEVFGPVAVLSRFSKFEEAIAGANDTRYGLQTGVFTGNLHHAMQAWDELEVGGVIVGDVPSWRVDNMPYGGTKESGIGREGVRYAIEDMTERRLLVIRDAAGAAGG